MATSFTPILVNNVGTTLAAGLTSSALTCSLTNVAQFPAFVPPHGASGSYSGTTFAYGLALTLISATNNAVFEIVGVTAISGNTATIIRAQEGTTALAFNAGDLANILITAGTFANLAALNGNPTVPFFASPGIGTGEVVTWDQFPSTFPATNTVVTTLPGLTKIIDQTFPTVVTATAGLFTTAVTLGTAFPNVCLDAIISYLGNSPPYNVGLCVQPANRAQVYVTTNGSPGTTPTPLGVVIRARGY